MMVNKMRDEYDIKTLNPRKNAYLKKEKQQVTMNINIKTIDYFKKCPLNLAYPIKH